MATLTIKPVATFDLRISIDCPLGKGFFTGKAKIRSKPENEALFERIKDGDVSGDEEVLRELYEGFTGLDCETGKEFDYLLTGPASAYLAPAAIQAYFEQYAQAKAGNSRPSRGR
jgi:hypothetical protein